VPDVACREDARHACFEQERRALKRPAVRLAGRGQVRTGENKALVIARHAALEPVSVRLGPDHREQHTGGHDLGGARPALPQRQGLQAAAATAVDDLST
jgi:hypothetical protein